MFLFFVVPLLLEIMIPTLFCYNKRWEKVFCSGQNMHRATSKASSVLRLATCFSLSLRDCYFKLPSHVFPSRCTEMSIKMNKGTRGMMTGRGTEGWGQGEAGKDCQRSLAMRTSEWPHRSPTQNNFLKRDRFIRIMGRFILRYLLHFVIWLYINRTDVSFNIFTKCSSAASRKMKKKKSLRNLRTSNKTLKEKEFLRASGGRNTLGVLGEHVQVEMLSMGEQEGEWRTDRDLLLPEPVPFLVGCAGVGGEGTNPPFWAGRTVNYLYQRRYLLLS